MYTKNCRICLSDEIDNATLLITTKQNDVSPSEMGQKYLECLQVELTDNKDYPNHICKHCKLLLNAFHNFMLMAQRSYKQFTGNGGIKSEVCSRVPEIEKPVESHGRDGDAQISAKNSYLNNEDELPGDQQEGEIMDYWVVKFIDDGEDFDNADHKKNIDLQKSKSDTHDCGENISSNSDDDVIFTKVNNEIIEVQDEDNDEAESQVKERQNDLFISKVKNEKTEESDNFIGVDVTLVNVLAKKGYAWDVPSIPKIENADQVKSEGTDKDSIDIGGKCQDLEDNDVIVKKDHTESESTDNWIVKFLDDDDETVRNIENHILELNDDGETENKDRDSEDDLIVVTDEESDRADGGNLNLRETKLTRENQIKDDWMVKSPANNLKRLDLTWDSGKVIGRGNASTKMDDKTYSNEKLETCFSICYNRNGDLDLVLVSPSKSPKDLSKCDQPEMLVKDVATKINDIVIKKRKHVDELVTASEKEITCDHQVFKGYDIIHSACILDCEVCGRSFKRRQTQNNLADLPIIKCELCDIAFIFRQSHSKHMQRHREEDPKKKCKHALRKQNYMLHSESILVCRMCGVKFENKYMYHILEICDQRYLNLPNSHSRMFAAAYDDIKYDMEKYETKNKNCRLRLTYHQYMRCVQRELEETNKLASTVAQALKHSNRRLKS